VSLEQFDEKYVVGQHGPVPRLAYPIEDAPAITGIPRTKIFEAVRAKQLTVRKVGRTTIIEHPELVRYLASLPTKGRLA
jgi:hypothetical protein